MEELTNKQTSKYLELDYGRVRYHEAGEGPNLLLLHGSGPGVTGWANYQGNLPVFAKQFRCIIVDFPGYGESDPVDGNPVSGCIDTVLKVLDVLEIRKTHIIGIGNSLGGIVGSHIAAKHPSLVERFVTIGGIGQ